MGGAGKFSPVGQISPPDGPFSPSRRRSEGDAADRVSPFLPPILESGTPKSGRSARSGMAVACHATGVRERPSARRTRKRSARREGPASLHFSPDGIVADRVPLLRRSSAWWNCHALLGLRQAVAHAGEKCGLGTCRRDDHGEISGGCPLDLSSRLGVRPANRPRTAPVRVSRFLQSARGNAGAADQAIVGAPRTGGRPRSAAGPVLRLRESRRLLSGQGKRRRGLAL